MRLLVLLGVFITFAASSATVASATVDRTPGGVWVSFSKGRGIAVIRNRGAFTGSMLRGTIWATNRVKVTGSDSRTRLGPNLVRYRGDSFMRVLVSNDVRWRIKFQGRGISGGGPTIKGCLILDAADAGPNYGTWKIRFRSGHWPRARTSYGLGTGSC